MDWLWRWKYRALLLSVLLILVVYPLLQESFEGRLFLDALLTFFFLMVLVVVFEHRHRVIAVILGIPTLIGLWTGYALPDISHHGARVGFHLLGALFLGVALAVILRAIHRSPRVTLDDVYGALSGYLLIALAFGHLYCLVEALAPGSFVLQDRPLGDPQDGGQFHYLLAYFSLSTLTTVGYGDMAPVRELARGLAMVEAVVGQFYLAVLIGELIGKRVSVAIAEQEEASRKP